MKVLARRSNGFAHEVEIEGGHTIVVDEPASVGGTDTGPAPTRLLAASLAACTAVTMELYAERKGWEMGPVEVGVEAEYEGAQPTAFEVRLRLSRELSDEQRERLTVIAAKCPVHRVLAGGAKVTVAGDVELI
ncbi:MAG TPA: OsmC family protein [Solirubrobacterales bacterium]|nr:OsmC family protein [Solirubrobacterales bacterium]